MGKAIPDLDPADVLNGSEQIEVIQNGVSKRTTTRDVWAFPAWQTVAGTTKTISNADFGKRFIFTADTEVTVTVDDDIVAPWFCYGKQKGNGQLHFVAASGDVTVQNELNHTRTARQLSKFSLSCDEDGVVDLDGSTAP